MSPATISTNTTPGGDMTLATIQALGSSIESAASWLKQALEEHLPAAVADAQKAESSPVIQALEAAVLTPAEESMVAELISKLPALRGAQSVPAAPFVAGQANIPADEPPPADVAPEPVAQPA